MAKTRLNGNHRHLLRQFANDNLSCPAEKKARDRAYAKAAKLVSEIVRKKFPVADMAILSKYEVGAPDACINGTAPDGRFLRFTFDAEDSLIPVVPNRYCSTRAMAWTVTATEAIDAFEKANNALDKALEAKRVNYQALINSARTFEEVVSVWPAAEALRDKIGAPSTALVALSDDVAAFIRSDNAGAGVTAIAA